MIIAKLTVLGAAAALVFTGCATTDSETDSTSPTSPATSELSPDALSANDGGCNVATVDGSTANAEVLALATQVYDSLRCDGDTTLDDQLRAAAESEAVTTAASEADLTINVDSVAGGSYMQIIQIDDRSSCSISVVDNLDAKSLSCLDI